ncbi:MAG: radical SAM protein, partial [uncultured bacterium]
SGSPDILSRLNKSARANDGALAIRICREHGIEPEIGFLMFVPEASLTDLRANLAFLQENQLLGRLARTANLLCHRQIVLAGTSGYARFAEQNRLKKKGIFGFQGEVALANPRIEWLAELTIFACHTILRKMADRKSQIYWQMAISPVFRTANDYLVRLFHHLLEQAAGKVSLESIESVRERIAREIGRIIGN